VIENMNNLVKSDVESEFEYAMGIEYLFTGPEYFKLARGISDLMDNYTKYEENNELAAVKEKLIKGAEGFFKNYDLGVDKKIFLLLTEEYMKQTSKVVGQVPQNYGQLTDEIYSKSFLTNKDRYIAFVKSISAKSAKKLKKDKGFTYWKGLFDGFVTTVVPKYRVFKGQMDELMKTYVKGKVEMFPDAKHWPDANGTLRITYGKLEGSAPTDGMQYTEHTTIDGIIAKHATGNADFELLPRMLEMHKNKEYGDYAQDGELWVCFTGSNHTTGGNSGSPVLDEKGNLMGLNFDRSWESTMSDYMFDPSRCRNIVVDIRYVMWVMDKYSGAKHLVDEMTLVKE